MVSSLVSRGIKGHWSNIVGGCDPIESPARPASPSRKTDSRPCWCFWRFRQDHRYQNVEPAVARSVPARSLGCERRQLESQPRRLVGGQVSYCYLQGLSRRVGLGASITSSLVRCSVRRCGSRPSRRSTRPGAPVKPAGGPSKRRRRSLFGQWLATVGYQGDEIITR